LIWGKIIAKVANFGSKNAGLSSDFWENCMILKKIFQWRFYSSAGLLDLSITLKLIQASYISYEGQNYSKLFHL
jgi:hypothetical protein